MWKLLIMIIVLNESGQTEQIQAEHRLTFATAAECYEAARDLYEQAPDVAVSVGHVCVKDAQGRRA
jgi:hypothetical protein